MPRPGIPARAVVNTRNLSSLDSTLVIYRRPGAVPTPSADTRDRDGKLSDLNDARGAGRHPRSVGEARECGFFVRVSAGGTCRCGPDLSRVVPNAS